MSLDYGSFDPDLIYELFGGTPPAKGGGKDSTGMPLVSPGDGGTFKDPPMIDFPIKALPMPQPGDPSIKDPTPPGGQPPGIPIPSGPVSSPGTPAPPRKFFGSVAPPPTTMPMQPQKSIYGMPSGGGGSFIDMLIQRMMKEQPPPPGWQPPPFDPSKPIIG